MITQIKTTLIQFGMQQSSKKIQANINMRKNINYQNMKEIIDKKLKKTNETIDCRFKDEYYCFQNYSNETYIIIIMELQKEKSKKDKNGKIVDLDLILTQKKIVFYAKFDPENFNEIFIKNMFSIIDQYNSNMKKELTQKLIDYNLKKIDEIFEKRISSPFQIKEIGKKFQFPNPLQMIIFNNKQNL